MDRRVEQAQTLFWEVEIMRRAGRLEDASPKLLAMALLHEHRALEMLKARDGGGWEDLFAAVTAYAEAGHVDRAALLLLRGHELLERFTAGRSAIHRELQTMEAWVRATQHPDPMPAASGRGRLSTVEAELVRAALLSLLRGQYGGVVARLANDLGVSPATVIAIRDGARAASLDTASRIAKLMSMPVAGLLGHDTSRARHAARGGRAFGRDDTPARKLARKTA